MPTRCLLHEADYHVVQIVVRIGLVGWGLLTIFPSLMMSDSGTELALATSMALLCSSLWFILAGVFGLWSLLVGAVSVMAIAFCSFPDGMRITLIKTLVPIALVLSSLCAVLEWRGWLQLWFQSEKQHDGQAQQYTHYMEATQPHTFV